MAGSCHLEPDAWPRLTKKVARPRKALPGTVSQCGQCGILAVREKLSSRPTQTMVATRLDPP